MTHNWQIIDNQFTIIFVKYVSIICEIDERTNLHNPSELQAFSQLSLHISIVEMLCRPQKEKWGCKLPTMAHHLSVICIGHSFFVLLQLAALCDLASIAWSFNSQGMEGEDLFKEAW